MNRPTPAAVLSGPLEQELDWYFSYAEGALRLGRVALLPAHEATGLTPGSDGAVILRAQQLASAVQSALRTSVLRRRASRLMRSALTAYERARSAVSTPTPAPKTPTATP